MVAAQEGPGDCGNCNACDCNCGGGGGDGGEIILILPLLICLAIVVVIAIIGAIVFFWVIFLNVFYSVQVHFSELKGSAAGRYAILEYDPTQEVEADPEAPPVTVRITASTEAVPDSNAVPAQQSMGKPTE